VTRDEAGLGEWLVAILVTLALTSLFAVGPVVQDILDAHSGRNGWRPQEQAAATRGLDLFVGPTPADTYRPCVLQFKKERGLEFTASGWRSPSSHPEPAYTADPAAYRGAIAVWKQSLSAYAQDYLKDALRACTPAAPISGEGPVAPVQEDPDVKGSYQVTLAYQGGPPAQCNPEGIVVPLQVAQPAKGRITVTFVGTPRVQEGALTSALSFEASHASGDTVRGQFAGPPDRLRIESGYLSLNQTDGDTPCAYTFTGQRIGS
jgi:hypothetical protein